jgi:hypothetical protein
MNFAQLATMMAASSQPVEQAALTCPLDDRLTTYAWFALSEISRVRIIKDMGLNVPVLDHLAIDAIVWNKILLQRAIDRGMWSSLIEAIKMEYKRIGS